MVIAIKIRCDWPGCKATIEVANQAGSVDNRGWKAEAMSLFAMHLCKEHRRNSWHKVKELQNHALIAAQTARTSGPAAPALDEPLA